MEAGTDFKFRDDLFDEKMDLKEQKIQRVEVVSR